MTRFDFVDRASEAAQARDELSGSEYWVNDQVLVRAFGKALDPSVADLVTVALSCYAADRLTRRSVDWSRRLDLRIALHNPDTWIDAREGLEAYLGTLTDDTWAFEFVAGRRARLSEQQATLFPVDLGGSGSVGLFSGGLDSLAGAATWLNKCDAPLVLLGARSSRVIGRDQHDGASGLRNAFGPRIIEVGIPLELRHSLSRESTQRTRGFLFLSLATAAALTAKAGEVVVFENGYGAHNPRLAENQFGSQATLATNPHLLRLFEHLLTSLGLPTAVRLPHRWETKAQLLRQLPVEFVPLVAGTSSCDGYPLRIAGRTHCGRCGSCVLRRQSLVAAGLEAADRHDYVRRPLERGVEASLATILMARQAWQFGELGRIDAWDEIAWRWPSLTIGLDEASWEQRAAILGLMNAFADEWVALVNSRPYLRSHLRWPSSSWQATA
jgi:7-cyano-7-deazaguanine synthase in queuosine biosynthesis